MKQFSVLIIDDHREWCQTLKEEIEKYPLFQVAEPLHNGKDAIDCIQRTRPDIIVLDLVMPIFDGMYVINHVRSQIPDYTPLIYVLSVIGTDKTNRILRDLDVDYCSVKPVSTSSVIYILHKLVNADYAEEEPSTSFVPTTGGLRDQIEDYLYQLGAPLYLLSTKCTCTVLQMCIENDWQFKNVTVIYANVAEQMKTTSSTAASVEHSIRHTIRRIQKIGQPFFLECFPNGKKKLTNAEFLTTSMYYLKRKTVEGSFYQSLSLAQSTPDSGLYTLTPDRDNGNK